MMEQLTFQLADQADDDAIRRLLRENPMGGDISLSLEREPSYFDFSEVEGPFHQAIIALEQGTNNLAGFASRSIRPYYINGIAQHLGYLGQLRFTPDHRRFFPLLKGFLFFRELHRDKRSAYYLTSIMEDNIAAKRVLLSGISGLPRYDEYCRFTTHTVSTLRKQQSQSLPDTIHIENGSATRLPDLIDFLHRNNKNRQFAPIWDENSLFHPDRTPGLTNKDFILAIEKDKIIGCMALWDQRQFKQAVIRAYSPHLARWRLLINFVAFFSNNPRLPAVNSTIAHCYLSHISIKEERSEIFRALLNKAMAVAKQRKIPLLTVGFASTHPFHTILEESYKTFKSLSRIFLVSWNDLDQAPLQLLDNRLPGIEVALL
jgi:hypothetical protein